MTLYNYNKWYWELYNEIEECSEELSLVIYKLRLPPVEKLWKDLTLNPLDELHDLMSRVKMFAHLEDNIRQAERATRISSRGNSKFKHRESTGDCKDRVRQGINVVFKEAIHKLFTQIRDKLCYRKPNPIGRYPTKHN